MLDDGSHDYLYDILCDKDNPEEGKIFRRFIRWQNKQDSMEVSVGCYKLSGDKYLIKEIDGNNFGNNHFGSLNTSEFKKFRKEELASEGVCRSGDPNCPILETDTLIGGKIYLYSVNCSSNDPRRGRQYKVVDAPGTYARMLDFGCYVTKTSESGKEYYELRSLKTSNPDFMFGSTEKMWASHFNTYAPSPPPGPDADIQ